MSKIFETQVRVKGADEWKPVTYGGERYYANDAGLGQLQQMASMMSQVFTNNEYKIVESIVE